jgi:Protein of unknown function (DUF3352)
VRVIKGRSDRSNPINQAGGPGDGKDPGENGTSQQEGRRFRRDRFRKRFSLPRPRIPRPRLRRRGKAPALGLEHPELPTFALQRGEGPGLDVEGPERPTFGPPSKLPVAGPPSEPPEPPRRRGRELWFRLITRLRAIRFWLREKGGAVGRRVRRAGVGVAYWWSKRSRATRIQIFAVVVIVAAYLVVKFASIPGIPCEISAAKECAPSNQTVGYVPTDAVLYAHVTVNSESHQWELAEDLGDELPNLVALLRTDTGDLATPGGRPIDLSREVLPWAKDDIALVGVAGPKKTVAQAYLVGVGDAAKADQFLASLSPGGKSKQSESDGGTLTVYANGFATGRVGEVALFGQIEAVRAALDSNAGRVPELTGTDQGAPLDQLPDVRLAELYLSRAGVERLLAGRPGGASQLDTFVDYGATTGMAVALRLRNDGAEVHLESRLDPTLEQRSPTVFAALPRFEPELADEAGGRALGYIGVGEIGPALNRAIATAGEGAQGLAGSLRALAQRLRKQAGVDPFRDLLPALGGQAALVAEPTEGVPYASLIVEGVDEKRATAALAALRRPLLRSISSGRQGPKFQTTEVDGVDVQSVQTSPTVNLSYAVFDGQLVISTQPAGIEQVRSGGDDLAGSGTYEEATDRLSDRVSALVFLNLDEVFGLAQQAGLATDPLYASLSEDISRIGSLGLAVIGSTSELRSELFLPIDY